MPETEKTNTFCESEGIEVELEEGENVLRLMNHRRQENTLDSYATLLREINVAKPDQEYGKMSTRTVLLPNTIKQ